MKNNYFTLLIFLFIVNHLKSQNHRFIYDVIYKKDSTSDLLTKENYHLDIEKAKTLYYTRDFHLADSLINNNIPFSKETKLNTSNVLIHKTGKTDFEEYDILENNILKLSSSDQQNWELTEEKKQVKNLILQKAKTTWSGRNWIAWFCVEIPFQEGPYKFRGLPGLILEVYDNKGNYKFELVKSEKLDSENENQFITMAEQMAVPVSWEKYKSTKLKYYDSPANFIKNSIGDSNSEQFYLNDGTIVNSNNIREINNSLKSNIKKYNNPIELDKAITYP